MIGFSSLIVRFSLSLSRADPEVKDVLYNGTNNEQIREMCLAVLSVCTEEKQYLDEIEEILLRGSTLDYMVVEYLKKHAGQSQQAEKLLKLNEEMKKEQSEGKQCW